MLLEVHQHDIPKAVKTVASKGMWQFKLLSDNSLEGSDDHKPQGDQDFLHDVDSMWSRSLAMEDCPELLAQGLHGSSIYVTSMRHVMSERWIVLIGAQYQQAKCLQCHCSATHT